MLLITHGWKETHFGGRQQYSRCLIKSLNKNNYKDFKIYDIIGISKFNNSKLVVYVE